VSFVLAIVIVLLILWLLGLGHFVHFDTTVHLAGNFHTIVVAVLILAVLVLVFRRF
jgi:hypothetical protein